MPTTPKAPAILTRRAFIASASLFALAGCTTQNAPGPSLAAAEPNWLTAPPGEPFPIQPVNLNEIPPQFHRQMVDDPTGQPAGTITVDPGARMLWLSMQGGKAMRYGVGVGREGFAWNGHARIARKAKWPRWTPPAEMVARDAEAAKWAAGMPPGPDNPLGARALYLYEGGRDTLYRLHGTSEPNSIGQAVSSGCVRLLNADVIDLYERVPLNTNVFVRGSGAAV
jgi:lipoprotein-anchoring transpeptidase ErfK/SrfK